MKNRKSTFTTGGFALALTVFAMGMLWSADERQYNPLQRGYYLSAKDAVWIRPGLDLKILNVSIPATRKAVVTFRITDEKGQPLDREGNLTPGPVSTSFILATLPQGADQYVAYTTRTATSSITKLTAVQASSDSGGSYLSLGDGTYTYTFGTVLPAGYDQTATHTLGIYARRDLREFELSRYVTNPIHDFVPDGRQVTRIRHVVATQDCNQCHNPLALHGGSRIETRLCILCHTPQTSDPDTGNTVDFKVMVHKIHMGEHLPSVQAGTPYQIIGFGQSVHDFSDVVFPQDVRNCRTCHKSAPQADNFRLKPTRAVCGACHDDVDFQSGKNHLGGFQTDDSNCARCHWPDMAFEYDVSIPGAHIAPYKSAQLRRPKFEILGVTNTFPGQKPSVQFKITDKTGAPVAPSAMGRLALRLAGPTTDYNWFISETATGASYVNGVATYAFTGSLPADAKGTYAAGIEGYFNTTVNPGTTKEFSYRDAGDNVVKYFAVTGSVVPRRTVVETGKCNRCHDKLQVHGNNRNAAEYCVGCHHPTFIDSGRRPASDLPNDSVHFKYMIHKIHTGEELENGYQTGRTDRSHLRFPGDRRDCATCHSGTSYTLPLASGLLPTTTPRGYWTPTLPVAAACLSCHDSLYAAAHAFVNTATFGESCAVCHREGAEFAVSRMHAR